MLDRLIHDVVLHVAPHKRVVFLEGPAGAGKTTLAVRRLENLLRDGVPAHSILVWVPQRALGRPYADALTAMKRAGGQVNIVTLGGLARRSIDLFWPLVAAQAGFAHPDREPVFLTLETTQYYMDRVADPFWQAGYFDGLSVRRQRLVSQIIDNLNKAAVVGFPHTEVAERLKRAWGGESARRRYYDHAQACANAFRSYCLANNLLDFSLQIEVFFAYVLNEPLCREYLFERYRHLIVDNIEEDTPRAHDLLRQWLSECESALLVMDRDAGYRAFLGADPRGAEDLKRVCHEWVALEDSRVMSPSVEELGWGLVRALISTGLSPRRPPLTRRRADLRDALRFELLRFQPQMLEWVADRVADLVHREGLPPDEIAILAPYLGDAMRFTLIEALDQRRVPVRSHRPSRALRDEPAVRCLLTLAAVTHPAWGRVPLPTDITCALMVAIEGMDLIRARLLTEIVYRRREGRPTFGTFAQIRVETQQRIGFALGERFERLREWLQEYSAAPGELDDFIARLFAQVLSRPGFGFHRNLDAGRATANLIESVRKFRRAVLHTLDDPDQLGAEYVRMVEQGVLASTYISGWQIEPRPAVLLAPAYTFLMLNRPVEVQFWLDIGSGGWWERLYQPLTHPYVLSRHWPVDKVWSDEDEYSARQLTLGKLLLGLVRRCRRCVYLGIADLGEQGYEQRGPLLRAVQRALRQSRLASGL